MRRRIRRRIHQVVSHVAERSLFDKSMIATAMCDLEGRFVMVNQALCQLVGYDAQTLLQMTWQELTDPHYLQADLDNRAGIPVGRSECYRLTKKFIHADGHPIWGELSVFCIGADDGQVEVLIGQIIDIIQVEAAARNRTLAKQLHSAATYMASIMPQGLRGPVTVSSRYLPSNELGGDCFDYAWIDDDHLMVELIDVSGHGIEPALLAASVQNVLRSGSLTTETLLTPEAVLSELNRLFPMEKQGNHFFTIWYGIYERSSRTMCYASAGAPPALAFSRGTDGRVASVELSTQVPPIGAFTDTEFTSRSYHVPPGCQILIYSDGISDCALADTGRLSREEFIQFSTQLVGPPNGSLEKLLEKLRSWTPLGKFEDDCSLIQITFD